MTHDVPGEANTGLLEAAPCLLGGGARPVREQAEVTQEQRFSQTGKLPTRRSISRPPADCAAVAACYQWADARSPCYPAATVGNPAGR
jgi:hypothetical protein